LIAVENLRVEYGRGSDAFVAADGVNLSIPKGEAYGLVGESGSGKTTVGRALVRLLPIAGGQIHYQGVSLPELTTAQFKPYRKKIQMIFQDPYSTLDPKLTLRSSMREALALGHPEDKANWEARAAEALRRVGLEPDFLSRYPHEFSGGQRQRLGIARVLCVEPEFVVCDEPVSSLDVSIQAQILNLLRELQDSMGWSTLFISHDLRVVRQICDQVAVMRRGRILAQGGLEDVFFRSQEPYVQELMNALPGRKNREFL
jgi:peptide/nickel transport system ATP-binding protein